MSLVRQWIKTGVAVAISDVVIPTMVHRPTTFTAKWWVQLFGHPLFVVTPMILVNRRFMRDRGAVAA